MIIRIVLIAVVTVSAFSIMSWYDRALCRCVEHSHLQWQLWSAPRHQGRDHRCRARGGRVKFYCPLKLEGTAPRPPKAEVAAVCTINKSFVTASAWNTGSLHNYKISR